MGVDAIVLFSHGSLLCGAGEALEAHAARLQARGCAPHVEIGYLNYSLPPFAETVARITGQGARHVLVVPYFLVPGKFVQVDFPRALQAAQTAHPDVLFQVTEAIGYDTLLADALIRSAQKAFGPEHWRDDLKRATRSCRVAPDCPLFDTPHCPKTSLLPESNRRNADEQNAAFSASFSITGESPRDLSTTALLVMVHGSPRPIANEAMFRVVEVVRERNIFAHVEVGFMECNTPDIPEAIARCLAKGVKQIVAVPYFLHTGTHVADDLPTLMEQAQTDYPDVVFRMGNYLGRSETLTDILQARIVAAGVSQTTAS